MIIVRDQKRQLWKYLIAGGAPTVVPGALPGDEPLSWSPGGEFIWVLNRRTAPATIFRIGLQGGHRTPWRELPYDDPAAIESEQLRVVMSSDGASSSTATTGICQSCTSRTDCDEIRISTGTPMPQVKDSPRDAV